MQTAMDIQYIRSLNENRQIQNPLTQNRIYMYMCYIREEKNKMK